jgi:hypothetical protein
MYLILFVLVVCMDAYELGRQHQIDSPEYYFTTKRSYAPVMRSTPQTPMPVHPTNRHHKAAKC